MSQDLHHAGENSYFSNIISMSEYYNFPCFDLTYLTKIKVKFYVSLMQQKCILYWQHVMQNSTKLEVFNTFKNDYTPSYLGLTNKLIRACTIQLDICDLFNIPFAQFGACSFGKSTSCMRMFDQQFRPNQFKPSFFISDCGRIFTGMSSFKYSMATK